MKIAVLGGGGIGLGTAALLASNGVSVAIWSRSNLGIQPLLDGKLLLASGAVSGRFLINASLCVEETIAGVQTVIVAVSGAGLKATLEQLAPHVSDGQLIIISSHLSFAALYLSKLLAQRGVKAEICAWASTVVTARRLGPGEVEVSSIRRELTAASLGSVKNGQELSTKFFPDTGFKQVESLIAVTLNNVNPTSHAAVALCNLTRMEYGEEWGSYFGISGAVGRLIEALDLERLSLARSFGMETHSLQQHWHRSFDLPLGSISDMAAEQNKRRRGRPLGPQTLEHRYVTEDLPFGIVPNIILGKISGIGMAAHEACLHLFDLLYHRDFQAENDLLANLSLNQLSKLDLIEICDKGF